MFHIIIHCRPKEENEEFFGKIAGAYASVLIDYKDYDGVMLLSKHYVENDGWEILEIENEYYIYENKEDLPTNLQEYFSDLPEYGYSLIFDMYTEEEEE